jgi:aspartokinase-like uncharacterized kinase
MRTTGPGREMVSGKMLKAISHIKASDVDYIQRLLDKEESVLEFRGRRVKNDDVLDAHTFIFNNGMELDIKICNGDGPWLDTVLFNEEGKEVFVTEPSHIWTDDIEVHYDGIVYCASFEIDGRN